MPTLPPWIRPTEGVPYFLQGASIGSNIRAREVEAQAQRDRLALAQMEEQRRQEEAVQNAAMQMRKIEELKSFEREKMAVDAAEKARQYAAQQEYEDAIKSGADPITALSRLGPRMGVSPAPLITAMERAKQAQSMASVPPLRVEEFEGKKFIVRTDKTGREYPLEIKPDTTTKERNKIKIDTLRSKISDMRADKRQIQGQVSVGDLDKASKDRVDAINKQIESMEKEIDMLAEGGTKDETKTEIPAANDITKRWFFNPATGNIEPR